MAQVPGLSEKEIIRSLGSFEHEKNILKRYARRGQCFSTTKGVADLKEEDVYLGYKDVERNGHVFSDGVGFMHPDLAAEVAKKLKFTHVSAIQFRLGGAKGVL
mmetsp:Transcript_29111/g.43876  ORF Transcript_29111/g.43876 Transcript_29111/m.43876 type:complete len:103 (-) Transcript_29111:2381-2689(-)